MITSNDSALMRVLIVGGGVAALETGLALRDLAGERMDITLLAPAGDFVLRPMLVARPFAKGEVTTVPLERAAAEIGARLVRGELARVDATDHEVLTTEGGRIGYDALVVTIGARPVPAFRRALTFTMEAEKDAMNGLLRDLEEGHAHRVAFVVPPGVTWSFPLYELALMTARQVWGMEMDDVEVHLVTPEESPLDLFGRAATDDVRRLLDRARIHLHAGSEAQQLADGSLLLHPSGERIDRARVVSLPRLEGPRVPGLPCDDDGFVPVDRHGRVAGLDGVYAAGDMTTWPIKQGGLAAQQADAIAELLAAEAGADIDPQPYRPVLRGTLITGREEHHMHSTEQGVGVASEQLMWWPPGKVAGRYLAPFLAGEVGDQLMDLPPFSHRSTPVAVALRSDVPTASRSAFS